MKKLDEILGTIATHLKSGPKRPLTTTLRNINSGEINVGYNPNKMYESQDSDYLKASDLDRQEHKVQIVAISDAEFKDNGRVKKKMILHFSNHAKTLVLNKTNKDAIAYAYGGDDSDPWIGKSIILYPTTVEFEGKSVEAIRVRPVLEQAPDPGMDALQKQADDDADSIPF